MWELRGGEDEKTFYDTYIKELLTKISNVLFWFGYRSGGVYGVRSCNKEFIQILFDAGFRFGCKTYTVRIPQQIREASKKHKAAFLRGLFATDGCFRLSKINNDTQATYPRASLKSASKQLIKDAQKILQEHNITAVASQSKNHFRLDINGQKQVQAFANKIGILQPKHQKRLKRYI